MPITTCVFDAYGTLFDVTDAARRFAARPGQEVFATKSTEIATIWRAKQLEYSWLRAVAGTYVDFWQVTQDGLDYALEASDLADPILREELLALYWELGAYPEVPAMLTALKDAGLSTAILSNGAPEMLDAAVRSAGIAPMLDAVLSVDSVGIFKPHPSVYDLVGKRFDTTPDQVLFVSSNGWDAAHSAAYGFHTVWVNRAGFPIDRLPVQPHVTISDLTTIPTVAKDIR